MSDIPRTRKKPTKHASPPGKKRGRPKASSSDQLPTSEAPPTRCGKCDSTARGRYYRTKEYAVTGVRHGKPFTHIVKRWTVCSDCGQHRVDVAHENRPENDTA